MTTTDESKKKIIAERQKKYTIDENDIEKGQNDYNICQQDEYILTDIEKRFLLAAERGDCASVQRMIDEFKDDPKEFNINCVDPLNRSALISAIENENFELIRLLLEEGIEVGDALLHAISEEYVEAVEELLIWEENHHIEERPYSWEAVDRSKSNFTADITPLILAAHRNNYEILKVLLDRGASLPMPHDVKCGCDLCVKSQETDSLRHSQSRINAYRALSSSSLIALSSRDPVLSAFELSWELKHLQVVESEFRAEYTEMRKTIEDFVSSLLDHARTSTELEIMLNYDHENTTEIWMPGDRQTLDRLKLAIKYKQKNFVAHPNVQQLLAAIWYDGLPGFRRKTSVQQIKQVLQLGCSFPLYSINYIVAPHSEKGKLMRKPFVKFIMHSTSYMLFLMLLGASSLRIIPIMFEMIGFPWMLDILNDWKKHERGSLPGPIELGIILYIISIIFEELKTLYEEGLWEYISDLWNIVDFISNQFYVTWILMRITAWIIAHRDLWYRGINPYFPREHWHPFDPMLIAEGAFAAGMIFSFLKLVHIFSINPHLGPLQVSLGRMIIDIIKFFFIYTLVLFAFGCGLNQLLWYYADLEKNKCYHLHRDVPDFDDQEKACTIYRRFANLFETSQSLFWASFGLVDLVSFDLAGIKGFTRFWALLLFGSYSVINIIVLLNMLIAMMSNSYQVIYEKSDTEWKFARSQLWMSYFEDGGTVPPPFNMCPTMKFIQNRFGRQKKRTKSIIRKALEKAQALHDKVMRLLVRRYVTAEQRKRDEFGITEDDIIEVRQDISTFRYELLDILNKNNMKVPDIDRKQNAGTKKGKVMKRRIMKDFQIGIVEKIASEIKKEGGISTDIFSTIAKAIGKRREPGKEMDWNAIVRQNTVTSNPIGSARSSLIRRSQRSIRRKMIEEANAGLDMDTDRLVELNPKLSGVTPTTRVAYVKFMQKTLTKREQLENTKGNSDNESDDANSKIPVADVKPEASKILRQFSASMKKPSNEKTETSSSNAAATKSSNVVTSNAPGNKQPDNAISKAGESNVPCDGVKGKAPSPPPSSEGGKSGGSSSNNNAGSKNEHNKSTTIPETPKSTTSITSSAAICASKPELNKSEHKILDNKKTDVKKAPMPPKSSNVGEGKSNNGESIDHGKKSSGNNDGEKRCTITNGNSTTAAGNSTDKSIPNKDQPAAPSKKSNSGTLSDENGENKNNQTDKKLSTSTNGKSSTVAGTTTDNNKSIENKDLTASLSTVGATSFAQISTQPDEKKSSDKTDKKDTNKKPDIIKSKEENKSGAGATSDRGKSTVTGRMISGWL